MHPKMPALLLAKIAMMIALTLLLQFVAGSISGGNQLLVGSIVNFGLLMSVMLCGVVGGVLVGLLTPLIGLGFGLLVNPLFFPFVAGSNAVFILLLWLVVRAFRTPHRRNLIFGFVAACVGKYLTMYLSAAVLLPLFLQNPNQLEILAQTWGVLQLLTVALGSLLAFLLSDQLRNVSLGSEQFLIQEPFRRNLCSKEPRTPDSKYS